MWLTFLTVRKSLSRIIDKLSFVCRAVRSEVLQYSVDAHVSASQQFDATSGKFATKSLL